MIRLINYAKHYLGHIIIMVLAGISCSIANVWIIFVFAKLLAKNFRKKFP